MAQPGGQRRLETHMHTHTYKQTHTGGAASLSVVDVLTLALYIVKSACFNTVAHLDFPLSNDSQSISFVLHTNRKPQALINKLTCSKKIAPAR